MQEEEKKHEDDSPVRIVSFDFLDYENFDKGMSHERPFNVAQSDDLNGSYEIERNSY